MRRPLLATAAERRREYENDLRDLIREVEGLQERVRGVGRDISSDYGGTGQDARERLGTASAALGLSLVFLRDAKRSLP